MSSEAGWPRQPEPRRRMTRPPGTRAYPPYYDAGQAPWPTGADSEQRRLGEVGDAAHAHGPGPQVAPIHVPGVEALFRATEPDEVESVHRQQVQPGLVAAPDEVRIRTPAPGFGEPDAIQRLARASQGAAGNQRRAGGG